MLHCDRYPENKFNSKERVTIFVTVVKGKQMEKFYKIICVCVFCVCVYLLYVYPDTNKRTAVHKDKIDDLGTYIPFLAYSIISMCDITPKLIELYKVFNSPPISKYFKPLNYTTYHMTVYNIWNQREKLLPYQIDQSGRAPKRESHAMHGAMKPVFLKMANKIGEFKDINEIEVTVSKKLRKGSAGISLSVDIRAPMQKSSNK